MITPCGSCGRTVFSKPDATCPACGGPTRNAGSAWVSVAGLALALAACGRGSATAESRTPDPPAGPVESADAAPEPAADVGPADPGDAPPPAPPEAIVTQVPEIPLGPCPADRPYQCTVALHAPAGGREVVYRGEGATLTFGFADFLAEATNRDEREVVAFLRGGVEDGTPIRLDATPGPPTNRWLFVVAALLDQGKARVHDDVAGRNVDSIVRETWDWVGCSGGCRQSGRQYRLRVPGDVFFRTTDLFGDSF